MHQAKQEWLPFECRCAAVIRFADFIRFAASILHLAHLMRAVLVGLALLCSSAAAALPTETRLTPDYLAESFSAVAHGREYEQGNFLLSRWPQDIRYRIVQQVADEQALTLIDMHLRQLSDITGRRFISVSKNAALDIYLTRQADWQQLVRDTLGAAAANNLHGAVCLASFSAPNGNIESAQVFIPIDQVRMQGKLVSCVVEELTQIMGLPNDSDAVFPSVFNDRSPEALLTPLDWLLLRLLYDDRLQSGMTKTGTAAPVRAILNGWQKDGTIDKARAEVLKGDLYRLLGRRQ